MYIIYSTRDRPSKNKYDKYYVDAPKKNSKTVLYTRLRAYNKRM